MPRDSRTYVWDALKAAELIAGFTAGKTFEDYAADDLLSSGVERQFEIIGEALNQLAKVDAELATRIPDQRRIVAFRNILIHGYATVDDPTVWRAVTDQVPGLIGVLRSLLDEDGTGLFS